MNIEKIRLDETFCNELQSLMYQVQCRTQIIKDILTGNVVVDSEMFKKYHDEYEEFFMYYELKKNDMIEIYIPEDLKNCNWNVDFVTQEIILTKVGC